MDVHSPSVLSDITGTAATELRSHPKQKGPLSCGKPSKECSSWNSILTALRSRGCESRGTQALCLPGRRAEAAPAAAGAHRTPQAGRDLQGSNLAHLLWGSCSIPTCSTVRTATKRLKATQIQGTLAAAYGPQLQCSWLEQSQHKRGLPHHSWLCHWFTEVTGFSSAPLPCTFTWCYYITTSLGGARISQCLLAFSC